MSPNEKHKLVTQIMSGVVIVEFSGNRYIIKEPDNINKVIAEQVYDKKLEEAISKSILTESESVKQLIAMDKWNNEEQSELDGMDEDISNTKLNLYRAYKSFRKLDPIRKKLRKLEKRRAELDSKRSVLRPNSAEGIAETARFRYSLCSNITDINGNKLWALGDYENQNSNLIEHLLSSYLSLQINEKTIRELCRTEPFRGLWVIGKSVSGTFSQTSAGLTSMQKAMVSWSRIYDNIYESPESPPTQVIEDNDLLDGWLTFQHKKREAEKSKRDNSEKGSNLKGDEVYLIAEDPDAVGRIYAMNDGQGKAIIKARQKQIDKSSKGLPAERTIDAQIELQNLARQKFKETVRK